MARLSLSAALLPSPSLIINKPFQICSDFIKNIFNTSRCIYAYNSVRIGFFEFLIAVIYSSVEVKLFEFQPVLLSRYKPALAHLGVEFQQECDIRDTVLNSIAVDNLYGFSKVSAIPLVCNR